MEPPTDQAYMVDVELFSTIALPNAETDVANAKRYATRSFITR
jgi:hypothetical protein